MSTENVQVLTNEIEEKPTVELIVNRKQRTVAISTNGATLGDLLNAAIVEHSDVLAVVTKNEDGTLALGGNVFVLRDGAMQPATDDLSTPVQDGDRVLVDRPESNAS